MPYTSNERIKKIFRKNDSQASSPFTQFPIGTDAQYIDMLSSLDLQEQLKLNGGNKSITIQEETDNDPFTITQIYFDKSLNEIFKVVTTIQVKNQAWLIDHLTENGTTTTVSVILGKGNSLEQFVEGNQYYGVTAQTGENANVYNYDRIEIKLYRKSGDNFDITPLHTKIIYINTQSSPNSILEEVI